MWWPWRRHALGAAAGKTTFIKNLLAAYAQDPDLRVNDAAGPDAAKTFESAPEKMCTTIVVRDHSTSTAFTYRVQDTPGAGAPAKRTCGHQLPTRQVVCVPGHGNLHALGVCSSDWRCNSSDMSTTLIQSLYSYRRQRILFESSPTHSTWCCGLKCERMEDRHRANSACKCPSHLLFPRWPLGTGAGAQHPTAHRKM